MAGIEKGSFGSPDETRTPEKMRLEAVNLGGMKAGRMTANPAENGPKANPSWRRRSVRLVMVGPSQERCTWSMTTVASST